MECVPLVVLPEMGVKGIRVGEAVGDVDGVTRATFHSNLECYLQSRETDIL